MEDELPDVVYPNKVRNTLLTTPGPSATRWLKSTIHGKTLPPQTWNEGRPDMPYLSYIAKK